MNVAEIISHHILDHNFGLTLGGVRLPITAHSVTIFGVSLFLFITLVWIAQAHKNRAGRLLTTLAEEYVSFIRDGIVLPNMGSEGRGMLYAVFVYFKRQFGRYDPSYENSHF